MDKMVSVLDVACYILEKKGKLAKMKLQKLLYYSQAWYIVWSGERLFVERIEAWVSGPVIPRLNESAKNEFYVSRHSIGGDSGLLIRDQKECVDAVLDCYGNRNSLWLSELCRAEEPWKEARKGTRMSKKGGSEITVESMAEYYSFMGEGSI